MTALGQHHHRSPTNGRPSPTSYGGSPSKSHFSRLNCFIYLILGFMVLHLMLSQSDPPEMLGSTSRVNGRTTTNKNRGKSSDRLPSYKKPEYRDVVAPIATENNRPVEEVHEVDTENLDMDDTVQEEQDDNYDYDDEESDNDDQSRDDDDEEEKGDEEVDEGKSSKNNADDVSEAQKLDNDIKANVQSLKASVDDVFLRIREDIQTKIASEMNTVGDEIKTYRNYVSEIFGELVMDHFPNDDDLVKEFEDVTLEYIDKKSERLLQKKFDYILEEASDDIDLLVLRDEDQGVDVNTMDQHLTEFESKRIEEASLDIEDLTKTIMEDMSNTVIDSTKDIIQRLMKKLGHPVKLRINGEGELDVLGEGVSNAVKFERTNALAAVEYVRDSFQGDQDDEADNDGDEEDDDDDDGDDEAGDEGSDDQPPPDNKRTGDSEAYSSGPEGDGKVDYKDDQADPANSTGNADANANDDANADNSETDDDTADEDNSETDDDAADEDNSETDDDAAAKDEKDE